MEHEMKKQKQDGVLVKRKERCVRRLICSSDKDNDDIFQCNTTFRKKHRKMSCAKSIDSHNKETPFKHM